MSAEANLLSAEANLLSAEANLLSAEAHLLSAEANFMSAEANFWYAEANLLSAETHFFYAETNAQPTQKQHRPYSIPSSLSFGEGWGEDLYFAISSQHLTALRTNNHLSFFRFHRQSKAFRCS